MNKNVENKIDGLLEEANQQVADATSKFRGGDAVMMSGLPLINTIGGMHAGYKAGKEMGHPIAGLLLRQEGAAGARSKWDPSTSIGDVYTGENMAKRAGQYGMGTLMGGLAAGGMHEPAALVATTAAGGLIGAATGPAIGYGLGKLFGSKTPDRVRAM